MMTNKEIKRDYYQTACPLTVQAYRICWQTSKPDVNHNGQKSYRENEVTMCELVAQEWRGRASGEHNNNNNNN